MEEELPGQDSSKEEEEPVSELAEERDVAMESMEEVNLCQELPEQDSRKDREEPATGSTNERDVDTPGTANKTPAAATGRTGAPVALTDVPCGRRPGGHLRSSTAAAARTCSGAGGSSQHASQPASPAPLGSGLGHPPKDPPQSPTIHNLKSQRQRHRQIRWR